MQWIRSPLLFCLVLGLIVLMVPRLVAAQLAPTGDHYAGRPTDAGYGGVVNSQGSYRVSVPLDLPPEHGGLSVPVQLTYGEHGVGAAGLGWHVPVSFIRDHTTLAWRRPIGITSATPVAPERISLMLEGRSVELVATATAYVARSNAPAIKVIKQSASTWMAYDGAGRTYIFSNTASQGLAEAGMWLLKDVTGPGGSRIHLEYSVTTPTWLPGTAGLTIDLTSVSYNPHPTTANCYKNAVNLTYNPDSSAPLSLSILGDRVLTRRHTLNTVDVSSKSDCTANGTLLRRYQLNYLNFGDPDTHLPRLQSVTMTGQQGTPEGTVALPVAAYMYGTATTEGVLTYVPTGQLESANIALSGVATDPPVDPPLPPGGIWYFSANRFLDFSGDGLPDYGGPTRVPPVVENKRTKFQGIPSLRVVEATHSLSEPRYGPSTSPSDDMQWRQAIDFNGDGRLDIIEASELAQTWVVYLNTPDPTDPTKTLWVRRVFRIDRLIQHLIESGLAVDPVFLPLSLRHTVRTGPETTTTLWKLMDINGDGYPDLVFSTPDNTIKAVFNVFGVHLLEATQLPRDNQLFSQPVTLLSNDSCGVEQWQSDAATGEHQTLVCGIVDVNGDGIADRVTNGSVQLGTGSVGPAGFFTAVMFSLPGPLASQFNSAKAFCTGASPAATFSVNEESGLRDINGDGIPDYIMQFAVGPLWGVYFGTGAGFAPLVIENPNAEFHGVHQFNLSSVHEDCAGELSNANFGLVDLNGDGKPDVYRQTNLYQLVGSGGVAGAPEAGRLVQIDNGYGATTTITYASAKVDTTTLHQVPFPEIVVSAVKTTGTKGLGGTLSETRYAYGDAELIFDPALDKFIFPGYRTQVALHPGDSSNQQGSATVTTTYALAPATAGMTQNQRFGRYLRAGRTRDVFVLTDNPFLTSPSAPNGVPLGTDPYALLQHFHNYDSHATLAAIDPRIISHTHYEWDTRYLSLSSDPVGAEFCWDMVLPYDYVGSKRYDTSQGNDSHHANFDACTAHGFAYALSIDSKRTALAATPPDPAFATANVETRSEVRTIDDFGRVLSVGHLNDVNRTDDDICVDTAYATPTGANARVLFAPASRTMTACGTSPMVLAKDSWEYDTLPAGSVSTGFPTAHLVERRDSTGTLLSTVRQFDATYDISTGNLISVTTKRNGTTDDGATYTETLTYDSFGLILMSVQTDATNGDGTPLPSMTVTLTRDPLTLNVLTATDPNGTQRSTTYDGFERLLLSEVTPPGGTLGVVASRSYLGFAGDDSLGRRITQTVFTDPVAPDSVATAAGRTSTVFLDELGRRRKTELALGTDYANQKLIAGARTYDGFGRVLFEAEPFLSTQNFNSAYGTTRYFNADGTPSCFVRGNGPQAFTNATDETHELYPACAQHTFQNHTEIVSVRDADSLLAGSGSNGVVKSSTLTAIGRPIDRSTSQVTLTGSTRKEYATFAYDRLGHLTGMTRYQNAAAGADLVTSSWHYDSLGWLLELDRPDSTPQFRTFSNWGELTQVQWCDATTAPCTDRRTIAKYDARRRVIHREDQTRNVVDAATVNDYAYDQPATFVPRLTPTNVLGRLASASSPGSKIVLSYDGLGRVNARGFNDLHGDTYIEKHTYHADGTLLQLDLLLPDTSYNDEKVDYTYDSAGRPRLLTYSDGTISQDLFTASGSTDIDPFGRIRQAHYGPAVLAARYADSGRRLLLNVSVTSPGGSHSREISHQPIAHDRSFYDPLGRERSRREIKDGDVNLPTLAFSYDTLGQLVTATRTTDAGTLSSVQFSYDALGNIQQQAYLGPTGPGNATLSYQSTDRDRICSIAYGPATPSAVCNVKYDGVGNIIAMPSRSNGMRTLEYFANGQVNLITDESGNRARFTYDAFGAVQTLDLTSTESPDTRHDRHFGARIAKRDEVVNGARTSVITRTIPGPGVIATRHGPTGTWTFAFGEGRGNRFFTDQNGAFVQDADYQPFGEVIPASSPGAQPGAPTYTSAQWNGGDALAALGVSQLGARMYDPVIGRFLSRDPLLIPRTGATTNPYAFANNDPVNASDPSGLMIDTGRCPVEDCVIIGGGGSTPGGPPDAISGADPATPPESGDGNGPWDFGPDGVLPDNSSGSSGGPRGPRGGGGGGARGEGRGGRSRGSPGANPFLLGEGPTSGAVAHDEDETDEGVKTAAEWSGAGATVLGHALGDKAISHVGLGFHYLVLGESAWEFGKNPSLSTGYELGSSFVDIILLEAGPWGWAGWTGKHALTWAHEQLADHRSALEKWAEDDEHQKFLAWKIESKKRLLELQYNLYKNDVCEEATVCELPFGPMWLPASNPLYGPWQQ